MTDGQELVIATCLVIGSELGLLCILAIQWAVWGRKEGVK